MLIVFVLVKHDNKALDRKNTRANIKLKSLLLMLGCLQLQRIIDRFNF